jgi:hypothetical protein
MIALTITLRALMIFPVVLSTRAICGQLMFGIGVPPSVRMFVVRDF